MLASSAQCPSDMGLEHSQTPVLMAEVHQQSFLNPIDLTMQTAQKGGSTLPNTSTDRADTPKLTTRMHMASKHVWAHVHTHTHTSLTCTHIYQVIFTPMLTYTLSDIA